MSRPGVVETADNGNDTAGFGENGNWGVNLKFSDAGAASAEQMGRVPVDLGTTDVISTSGGSPCHYTPAHGSIASPSATFLDLNGENARGNWALCVGDSAAADVGTLESWSLTLR